MSNLPFSLPRHSPHKVYGQLDFNPPLSQKEVDFLNNFITNKHFHSNHMLEEDVYSIDGSNSIPMPSRDATLTDLLKQSVDMVLQQKFQIFPSMSTPFTLIENNGNYSITVDPKNKEKRLTPEWTLFLINHFLKKDCIAKLLYPEAYYFLNEHKVNGSLWYKTEKTWLAHKIEVNDNELKLFAVNIPVEAEMKNNKKGITTKLNVNLNNIGNMHYDFKKEDSKLFDMLYNSVSIQSIVDANDIVTELEVNLSQHEKLNTLIFAAQLNRELKSQITTTKKIKI